MLKLRTVYPYGLNDRVGDEYKTENSHVAVANKFPSLSRKNVRVKRGVARHGNNNMTPVRFITEFKEKLHHSLKDVLNFIRVSLSF